MVTVIDVVALLLARSILPMKKQAGVLEPRAVGLVFKVACHTHNDVLRTV